MFNVHDYEQLNGYANNIFGIIETDYEMYD